MDPKKKPTEFDLGKLLLDCAAEVGVKHVVWSSVSSSKKISNGQVVIDAMESMSPVDDLSNLLCLV